MMTQTIPQPTGWKGLSGLGDEVVVKKPAQCLNTRRIQGRQKATERGAMRQLLPIEEGHEWDRKWGE